MCALVALGNLARRRLRWSVAVEVLIATVVLGATAMLVNSPTARESHNPPASATAAFDTGGPQGSGTVSVVMTPDRLGPNQLRLSLAGTSGRPYRPTEIDASLALPERNLGPLAIKLTAGKQPGTYLGGPAIVMTLGVH